MKVAPEEMEAQQTKGEEHVASSPDINEIEGGKESEEKANNSSVGTSKKSLKVLFLSSDTGGGHRASAESLARQFELLFPGSTYDLLDLATETYLPPYNSIVSYYKHLSAHPSHWKLLYGVTNSKFMEKAVDTNIKVMTVVCERSIRKRIKSYHPDVVVSVHPLQTSVPILSCAKISHETGQHLPMFTVVTDLGSAHATWFANGVEKMFVGSTQIYELAKERGKVPDDKLVLLGLPIRHDFAVESEKLGERMSPEGVKYQKQVRERLGLPALDRKTLLVMGGGEGVGLLSNIVDALYYEFTKQGIDAVIMVVCGRNETLKSSLATRDWKEVIQTHATRPKLDANETKRRSLFPSTLFGDLSSCGEDYVAPVGCIEAPSVTRSIRRILSSGTLLHSESPVFIPSPTKTMPIEDEKKDDKTPTKCTDEPAAHFRSKSIGPIEVHAPKTLVSVDEDADNIVPPAASTVDSGVVEPSPSDGTEEQATEDEVPTSTGKVDVVGLGFVSNMAEYMVAADVLISKAGPGTISEAAALALPVMLTSFLPGQEEGNVDFVVDGGFGAYCHDSDPQVVAEEMAQWLNDDDKMKRMSDAAKLKGAPYAARDIVQQIGDSTLKWREHNEAQALTPKKKPLPASLAMTSSVKVESSSVKKSVTPAKKGQVGTVAVEAR